MNPRDFTIWLAGYLQANRYGLDQNEIAEIRKKLETVTPRPPRRLHIVFRGEP